MKRIDLNIRTTVLHACLVTALIVLPACSGQSDLTGPDPAESLGDVSLIQALGCPTFADACDELGEAVYEACPWNALADPGDIALCKFLAFNKEFAKYKFCFTTAERFALYDCVKVWEPAPAPVPPPIGEDDDDDGGSRRLPGVTPAKGHTRPVREAVETRVR